MKKFLLFFVLMFAACSGPAQAPDSSHVAVNRSLLSEYPVYCVDDRECKELDPAPYCELPSLTYCGSDNTCKFYLDTTTLHTCMCIEGDIRFCSLDTSPATTGIQTCTVTTDIRDHKLESWSTCTAGYSGTVSSYGLNNCRGTEDCLEAADFPACGSTGVGHDEAHPELWEDTDIFCDYPPGVTDHQECIIGLTTEPSAPDCICVERDVRTCTTSSMTPGHQTCVVTGTSTNQWGHSTDWGTCT